MFFLIYASSAVMHFSPSDLLALLKKAREKNTTLGVTGMLLYKDGNFMQILEGDEENVRQIYNKISTDPRHTGLIKFLEGSEEERQFPDWSMGFRDLDSEEEISEAGYSQFMNTRFTGEEFSAHPTRAQRLLLSFKKRM